MRRWCSPLRSVAGRQLSRKSASLGPAIRRSGARGGACALVPRGERALRRLMSIAITTSVAAPAWAQSTATRGDASASDAHAGNVTHGADSSPSSVQSDALSVRRSEREVGAADGVARFAPPAQAAGMAVLRDPVSEGADIAALGQELTPRKYAAARPDGAFEVHGSLRARGARLGNLDLDRGLDPDGHALYAVPLDGGQWLHVGDMRLRTDLTYWAPGVGVVVKSRVDWLDNVGWGATPIAGTARAASAAVAPGQRGLAPVVKRAWAEVLLPFGVLAVGRMGTHFGLGMVANGGDGPDANGGDAADRVAVTSPVFGHIVAASYDLAAAGPFRQARQGDHVIDLTPMDDVRAWTLGIYRVSTPATRARRLAAQRTTLEYAGYYSRRAQSRDVPAAFGAPSEAGGWDQGLAAGLLQRDFVAHAVGGWGRVLTPRWRLEVEATALWARIGQPSTIPGVELTQTATSRQWGAAMQTEARLGRVILAAHVGAASGDAAPGFGAFVAPGAGPTQPGSFDGPQANFPRDTTVDNLRFHPDYIIDEILFRRIIGTITDAAYLKPQVSLRLAQVGTTALDAHLAAVASWAMQTSSTPSGSRALGLEWIAGVKLWSRDGFALSATGAWLLPGAAFDGHDAQGLPRAAQSAQLVRADARFHF